MRRLVMLLACAALLAACPPAQAAEDVKGGVWSSEYITTPDGTKLHAEILRPEKGGKTPVILTVSPYNNSSGALGPLGALDDAYDPVGPNSGTFANYTDLLADPRLVEHYTYVIVDLRGTGGSSGCQDFGGPGEQEDVVAAVDWAASQEWSTGKVGIYGKSYDGVTGLIGAAHKPRGLDAVIAMEPVYDNYRYLYGDGMRRTNWAGTPAAYTQISASPGALANTPDDPEYTVNSVNSDTGRPGCHAANYLDQVADDDHASDFWQARNLIEKIKGSTVPLFVTQGMTENNTAPDGFAEFLANHAGPQRGWLGPWNHIRPTAKQGNRLMMGRPGWFDEVFRFFDEHLRGIAPSGRDPNFVVQTNDGKWREEAQWPPADAAEFTTKLRGGSYTDNADSTATGAGSETGIWTVSQPLTETVHLAGAATVKLDVSAALPNANLVVDVYDIGPDGRGPRVARQGHLVRESGEMTLRLMSADWKFAKGRRIGVRITDNNTDWWLLAIPTKQEVTVDDASITLPLLTQPRTATIPGQASVELAPYLSQRATMPADTPETEFTLP
jgi:predicted acyl esterase